MTFLNPKVKLYTRFSGYRITSKSQWVSSINNFYKSSHLDKSHSKLVDVSSGTVVGISCFDLPTSIPSTSCNRSHFSLGNCLSLFHMVLVGLQIGVFCYSGHGNQSRRRASDRSRANQIPCMWFYTQIMGKRSFFAWRWFPETQEPGLPWKQTTPSPPPAGSPLRDRKIKSVRMRPLHREWARERASLWHHSSHWIQPCPKQ